MEVLSIENVAKHEKDTTLFPSFDLKNISNIASPFIQV
ncbi:hypothetical protein HNQ35_002100 [Cerasibacillus quisquiliarum]|nr:hypothetical protein [Cerasibacillus quisquiliarum]